MLRRLNLKDESFRDTKRIVKKPGLQDFVKSSVSVSAVIHAQTSDLKSNTLFKQFIVFKIVIRLLLLSLTPSAA